MSGDTTLLETRNSIGRIIYLSDLTLQAALSGLEMTTDQRLSLNSEEKELIEQQIDDLSRTLTLIEELFEEQRLEEAQEDE